MKIYFCIETLGLIIERVLNSSNIHSLIVLSLAALKFPKRIARKRFSIIICPNETITMKKIPAMMSLDPHIAEYIT